MSIGALKAPTAALDGALVALAEAGRVNSASATLDDRRVWALKWNGHREKAPRQSRLDALVWRGGGLLLTYWRRSFTPSRRSTTRAVRVLARRSPFPIYIRETANERIIPPHGLAAAGE